MRVDDPLSSVVGVAAEGPLVAGEEVGEATLVGGGECGGLWFASLAAVAAAAAAAAAL